jgi:serine/threonine-protein kinase HipA
MWSNDSLATVIRQLTGELGYQEYVRRLVAMIVVGNTDAHLKNWALIYRDGRTPSLAPVYDFHSLTIYNQYRYAPLALSLNEETVPSAIGLDHFRRLAERSGADPAKTVGVVAETVERLRAAWADELQVEATTGFEALATHFSRRLDSLPICTVA